MSLNLVFSSLSFIVLTPSFDVSAIVRGVYDGRPRPVNRKVPGLMYRMSEPTMCGQGHCA